MHKSRLILFCVIILVLAGARSAKPQDGVASLENQIQNKYSEREPDKPATTHQKDKTQPKNNDDGHRKHWWSMPHFRHKKKDENAASPHHAESKLNSKKMGAKPSSKTSAPQSSGHKTASNRPQHTAVATKRNTHNPVASATAHRKTVSATSRASKPQQHNCSATQAKSGGCQAVQKRSGKTSTSRS